MSLKYDINVMLSRNCKHVYPVNPDITEFDLDTDIEEYNYDGREVFRGNLDPQYSTSKMSVYWLYEDDKRVGLVEHFEDKHDCYWFRDNVFSSLLQEDWTMQDRTIWNMMSEEAYEDCMRKRLDTPEKLKQYTSIEIITPADIIAYKSVEKCCIKCQSTKLYKGCITDKKSSPVFDVFYTLFVDSDGIIYVPPSDTKVYSMLLEQVKRPCDDAQVPQVPQELAS
jgi:hypothetical protein